MQIDTLYLDIAEVQALYYDGAARLSEDSQAVIRQFIATVAATEERYRRATERLAGQMAPTDMDGQPVLPEFKAKIHIHFVVEQV